MNTADVMAWLLLVLLSTSISAGAAMILLVKGFNHRKKGEALVLSPRKANDEIFQSFPASFLNRPESWLAIQNNDLNAVRVALGLHHPRPCSWTEGLRCDHKLFIAPPIKGWILVMGTGIPQPEDDVDHCFRLIRRLSRALGQVQFFHASSVLNHHAWVKAERGRIIRAFAWAGETLWKQGRRTQAEAELEMTCPDYLESAPETLSLHNQLGRNVEKVPLLAARWSIDPAAIDAHQLEQELGIAGQPASFV